MLENLEALLPQTYTYIPQQVHLISLVQWNYSFNMIRNICAKPKKCAKIKTYKPEHIAIRQYPGPHHKVESLVQKHL